MLLPAPAASFPASEADWSALLSDCSVVSSDEPRGMRRGDVMGEVTGEVDSEAVPTGEADSEDEDDSSGAAEALESAVPLRGEHGAVTLTAVPSAAADEKDGDLPMAID